MSIENIERYIEKIKEELEIMKETDLRKGRYSKTEYVIVQRILYHNGPLAQIELLDHLMDARAKDYGSFPHGRNVAIKIINDMVITNIIKRTIGKSNSRIYKLADDVKLRALGITREEEEEDKEKLEPPEPAKKNILPTPEKVEIPEDITEEPPEDIPED